MDTVVINQLFSELSRLFSASDLRRMDMKVLGPSGLGIRVDGEQALSSINVWPTGCCDVEFLLIASEKQEFLHLEYKSTAEALSGVVPHIRAALERA